MGDVTEKFIAPLLVYWDIPARRKKAVQADLVKRLSRFSDDRLEKGADYIIRTHGEKSFPLPKQCFDACEKFRPSGEVVNKNKISVQKGEEGFDEWCAYYQKIIDDRDCEGGANNNQVAFVRGKLSMARRHGFLRVTKRFPPEK